MPSPRSGRLACSPGEGVAPEPWEQRAQCPGAPRCGAIRAFVVDRQHEAHDRHEGKARSFSRRAMDVRSRDRRSRLQLPGGHQRLSLERRPIPAGRSIPRGTQAADGRTVDGQGFPTKNENSGTRAAASCRTLSTDSGEAVPLPGTVSPHSFPVDQMGLGPGQAPVRIPRKLAATHWQGRTGPGS